MGLFDRWFGLWSTESMQAPASDARMERAEPLRFGVDVPAELLEVMTEGGVIAPRIRRDVALQVPAVLRARNLICGTLASLPHVVHRPDRTEEPTTYLLGGNVDPDIPNSVVLAQTYEDLLFEGIAWWRSLEFGWHGYPTRAKHVPVGSVHVAGVGGLPSRQNISADQPFPTGGQVFIDGVPVPDREVIRFDSPNPPLLVHAARAIRTALKLDRATALYADDPMPLGYFAPKDNAEVGSSEEIQALLDEWEQARSTRAWGYVGAALEAKALQWNPEQLQLADQRQHAVLEIARAAGVDPEDLGVSTTSRTYQNAEQRRQDLLDFTLGAYVTAMQDRLSMRDILPRGYEAKVKFAGFLRSDTKTRMETYEIGMRVGAYTDDEIRELEDKPALTAAQKTAVRQQTQEPTMEPQTDGVAAARFSDDGERTVTVTFDDDDAYESFKVDADKRTISGIVVPWGKIARAGFAKWKFPEGALRWTQTSRIKLNTDHDHKQPIAKAVRLASTPRGLDATFKVGRGAEGDAALASAEDGIRDGFSIEVAFEDEAGDSWQQDPSDDSVRMARQARLTGVALTAVPSFDDARVSSVMASRKVEDMPETKTVDTPTGNGDGGLQFDMEKFTDKVSEATAASVERVTKDISASFGEAVTEGIRATLENLHDPQRDGPQPVRAARFTVVSEPPAYTMNGNGPCMVRDAWNARFHGDDEAFARLRKFHFQTQEMAKVAHQQLRFKTDAQLAFDVDTTSGAEVIPPGYRPDLFVPQLVRQRPFVSSLSRGVISNATPFVVPTFVSSSGVTADHVEGTDPSDGTLTLDTVTVTPGAISGLLKLTREIVDSSNPSIDQIALAAMRESYAQQTEAKVYTLLNGASGAGGTITTGFVPSGAQVTTSTGAAADGTSGANLLDAVRQQLALYPFRRFAAPDIALMSQEATTAFATAKDTAGRPLLPSVGAANTSGVGNAVTQGWFVDGLAHVPAWAITGNTAGDADVFILNSGDAWAWESPTLTFRYEERSGPTYIDLALFGYFATHILRPVGLSAVRHTVT